MTMRIEIPDGFQWSLNISKEVTEQFLNNPDFLGAYIDALQRVRSGEIEQFDFGICHNAAFLIRGMEIPDLKLPEYFEVTSGTYNLTSYYAATWEGCRDPNCVVSYPVFHRADYDLWEGPNLEARHSLIDHCIECATRDLDKLKI